MGMIEDMLLAEAVVPRTFGAVAELEVRKIRVRAAADLALVVVALLPLLLLQLPQVSLFRQEREYQPVHRYNSARRDI